MESRCYELRCKGKELAKSHVHASLFAVEQAEKRLFMKNSWSEIIAVPSFIEKPHLVFGIVGKGVSGNYSGEGQFGH